MILRARAAGEGPGVFLERISGEDQEEVTSRAARGIVGVSDEEAE